MTRVYWILLLLLAGCQAPPEVAPVAGKVTIAGQPPGAAGQITFYPTDGRRPGIGQIQPDGTFQLTTFQEGDGAFLGTHRVAISIRRPELPAPRGKDLASEGAAVPIGVIWVVPEQYASEDTSGLTATVQRVEINEIDFRLP